MAPSGLGVSWQQKGGVKPFELHCLTRHRDDYGDEMVISKVIMIVIVRTWWKRWYNGDWGFRRWRWWSLSPRGDGCYPWGQCRAQGQRGRCQSKPKCLQIIIIMIIIDYEDENHLNTYLLQGHILFNKIKLQTRRLVGLNSLEAWIFMKNLRVIPNLRAELPNQRYTIDNST